MFLVLFFKEIRVFLRRQKNTEVILKFQSLS